MTASSMDWSQFTEQDFQKLQQPLQAREASRLNGKFSLGSLQFTVSRDAMHGEPDRIAFFVQAPEQPALALHSPQQTFTDFPFLGASLQIPATELTALTYAKFQQQVQEKLLQFKLPPSATLMTAGGETTLAQRKQKFLQALPPNLREALKPPKTRTAVQAQEAQSAIARTSHIPKTISADKEKPESMVYRGLKETVHRFIQKNFRLPDIGHALQGACHTAIVRLQKSYSH